MRRGQGGGSPRRVYSSCPLPGSPLSQQLPLEERGAPVPESRALGSHCDQEGQPSPETSGVTTFAQTHQKSLSYSFSNTECPR